MRVDNIRFLKTLDSNILKEYLLKAKENGGSYSPTHPNGPYYSISEIKEVLDGNRKRK